MRALAQCLVSIQKNLNKYLLNKDIKKGFIRLKVSKEANGATEGFKGRIPNFQKKGRRPGNYKEQAAELR